MNNNALQKLINDIYADSNVSPLEYIQFKTVSDVAVTELLEIEGDGGTTNALCNSFEITNHLLQLTLLKMLYDAGNQAYKDSLMKVINSQIELLKLNVDLLE